MSKTIAAIITPIGEGGIGVVQVTGPSALTIVNKIFISGNIKNLELAEDNRLYYGTIHDKDNNQIDEAIINVYRKTDSRKSEDIVEINCHGGIYLVRKILDLAVACGAYRADWQESAAHLAGLRLKHCPSPDSIQNEALQELPNARTRLSAKVILDQYMGALSSSVSNLTKQIEYVEHFYNQRQIDTDLHKHDSNISLILSDIKRLLDTFNFGKAITRPENIVIIGKPNVGKSALINRLLGKDRVIVHHEPGTTRDPITELISIRGIPYNLIDTAGIRETNHIIEKKGIEITNELILKADKLILMFDSAAPLEKDDIDILNLVVTAHKTNAQLIPVLNKIDLKAMTNKDQFDDLFQLLENHLNKTDLIEISALNGTGISELEERIISEFKDCINYKPGDPIIFRDRQFELLSEVRKRLDKIIRLNHMPAEIHTYSNLLKESKEMIYLALHK